MKRNRFLANSRYLYILIALGIIILMVLNFWGLFFIRQLEKQILEQLKIQISQIGLVSAKLIDGSEIEKLYPGAETTPPALYYQQLLWEIKRSGNLQDVFIASLDKTLLVHYQVNYSIGGKILFPINDSLFAAAAAGKTPQPELLSLKNQYFLTSYTPIVDDLGEVVGVLILEAPAHFFSTLYRFRKGLFTLGIGSMIIILLFSILIVLAVRQIFRVERQLQEQTRLVHLGQMAAMVAHEIRNPLSIIKGSAEVLKKKYAHTDDELFQFIPEEIERLNRLVNDFLQFARRRQLNLQTIDPQSIVQSVTKQFNDPRIHLELSQQSEKIQLDTDALKQILFNLIENARQATPENGEIQVESQFVKTRHPYWRLTIKDNGKGMDEETLSRIFDPFYSTRASGSGLGMTITRQLVEQMNGKIEVFSQLKQGTTVIIQFPL